MKPIEEIRPIIEEKLRGMGLELYELKFHPAGRKSILRIYIDKDAGVTIADCETASRELSVLLDVEEFSSAPYSLEVSSPGADRPLRTARDFARMKGRDVAIELASAVQDMMRVSGTVVSAGDDAVELQTAAGVVRVPLQSIRQGSIILKF
jgi:ribosome maturation factor RimP